MLNVVTHSYFPIILISALVYEFLSTMILYKYSFRDSTKIIFNDIYYGIQILILATILIIAISYLEFRIRRKFMLRIMYDMLNAIYLVYCIFIIISVMLEIFMQSNEYTYSYRLPCLFSMYFIVKSFDLLSKDIAENVVVE